MPIFAEEAAKTLDVVKFDKLIMQISDMRLSIAGTSVNLVNIRVLRLSEGINVLAAQNLRTGVRAEVRSTVSWKQASNIDADFKAARQWA